ncbi:MAG: hypothetical protein IIV16_01815 [Alistipes sp.]|nr:hypothetical protein [Alistipes sp.]
MKKFFNLLLAALAVVSVACTPNNEEGAENNNGNNNGPSDNTFVLNVVNIWATDATAIVTPSNNDTYYCGHITKERYDAYEGENIAQMLADELKAKCEEKGVSVSNYLFYGKKSIQFVGQLTPDTEYYAFVFGLSNDAVVTTDITTVPFKTLTQEEAAAGIDSGNKNIEGLVRGRVSNYEDYYEVGASNWLIVLHDESGLGELNIELLAAPSATELPVGEFPIASSMAVGTAIAGNLDEAYLMYGTFWTLRANDKITMVEKTFLKSGTVTINKSGDNYTIGINALDGHGNTFTTSYTGALEVR